MPTYTSYIADIDAPGFYWDDIPDEKYRLGNSPPRLVPKEWYIDLPFSYFWLSKQIESGKFQGKQFDWGGWGIVIQKADILLLLREQQDTQKENKPLALKDIVLDSEKKHDQIILEVEKTLIDNKNYILVVLERA